MRIFFRAISVVQLMLLLSAACAFAQNQSDTQAATSQNVFYKQITSPLDIQSALLLSETLTGQIVTKQLVVKKIKNSEILRQEHNALNAYAILAFIDSELMPKALLLSGNNSAKLYVDYSLILSSKDLYNISAFETKSTDSSAELDSNIKLLKAETAFEHTKLVQLKQKVSEISRLNRLVQALNTVSSLERRLAELQQDRESLENLIKLVPYQQLGSRQAILENQLTLELTAIRDIYSRRAGINQEELSPENVQQLNSLVQQASKLNVEELRARLYELREGLASSENEVIDLNKEEDNAGEDSQEQQAGTVDNPL